MSNYVIGIDPDSEKYGMALYKDGKLTSLLSRNVPGAWLYIDELAKRQSEGHLVTAVVENVKGKSCVFRQRSDGKSRAAFGVVAQRLGMCKQSQTVIVDILRHHEIKTILMPPQKGNFADNRSLFEKATGWKGRSNKDTRSAAFFGYLYHNPLYNK